MKLRLVLSTSAFIAFSCLPSLWAQSDRTTFQRDINGRVLATDATSTKDGKTELSRMVNGRAVPAEQVDEHIVRQDSTGKTVERTVRKYGADGRLFSTERVVVEETLRPGGSTVKESTFRTDINGRSVEAERRVTDTRTQGQTSNVEITLQQPSINGGFETAERRTKVTTGPPDNQQSTESVYRPGGGQGLREAQRIVSSSTTKGDQTTSNTQLYEPGLGGSTGGLQPGRQTVAVTTKKPDGSEIVDTTVYGRVPGRADSNNAAQQPQEAQRLDRRLAKDGSVVETMSVRRSTPSDPGRLGPAQQISETVCRGKCLPDKADAKQTASTVSGKP